MPRKKKDPPGDGLMTDLAVGVAGWLLIIETMTMLERRGVLREKDTLRIIANASTALETLAADRPGHPTFRVAKIIMDSQLIGWNREDLG